ncbi:CBN-SMG-2 protein [Caenorhabditis brenneri]|uniref:CBN-SMG-2 protein n=1 Tax=Caenorhabditis brenneri TaxID=135651 RepID=G0P4W4_CAEBE|nr:CBN-SMG-2 protein [Caenorhabditis brenneri]
MKHSSRRDPSTLSSNSINLVNLAYRSIPMPSIHGICILNSTKSEFQNHVLALRLADLTKQLERTNKNSKEYGRLAWQCYNMRTSIYRSIFSTKRAIFTTLGTSSIQKLPEYDWNADVMLVDEAAQCTEPATWVPVLSLPTCKKLVLVGDHKQLPAVVLSDEANRGNFKLSLMEKLSNEFESNNINILLNEQYRMNAKLMHWSNEVFYDNQLRANERVANITLSDLSTTLPADHVFNSPIFMIDMAKVGDRSQEATHSHSFKNTDELKIITEYVNRLVCDLGINPKDIAVIAPYYAQIEEIRRFMPFHVDVNTVDAFQGHEREVVIFCLVRDNTEGSIGFLNETRRLNVAVTRAKRQFVLVGNSKMMHRNGHLRKLYRHLKSAKMVFGPSVLDSFNHIDSAGLPPSDKDYHLSDKDTPDCSFR